jgi:cytochrome c oxidase subunit II
VRYWSVLFALAAIFCIATTLYAPFDPDWRLPEYRNTNPEPYRINDALKGLVRDQAQLLAEIQAAPDAVRQARLAERLAELRAALGRDRDSLADLAGRHILLPGTREAAARAASAVEQMEGAHQALQQGQAEKAAASQERALEDLRGADSALSQALAAIDRTANSSSGRDVDHLFNICLGITGIVFVGTQIALVWAAWRFAAREGRAAQYFHGSQRLEVVWTIIPSAILVFIALYQMGTWAEIKFRSSLPKVLPLAEVTARQFQWMIRYPGPDGRLGTIDDLHTVNDLRFVRGAPAVIHLKSQDVLHSFFLPQLRIKQDAVPGLTIPVWFDADTAGRYELVCAELCGWGHYKMRGNVTVYGTQDDFDRWMDEALKEQARDHPEAGSVAVASGPQREH